MSERWEAWKERNDDWWPFVAIPLLAIVLIAYAIFWIPYICTGFILGFHRHG